MGVERNISHDKFPKQGMWIKKRVKVCFNYDADHHVMGTIVRDDAEYPHKTIIQLDDDRVVLATECQYSPVN
jgi:hypothetical protein